MENLSQENLQHKLKTIEEENQHLKEIIENYERQIGSFLSEIDIREKLQSYFSLAVMDMGLTAQSELFKPRKAVATVMFTDMRGFTTLSEKMGMELLISLLNEYFDSMISVVLKRKGIVDKLIGDSILAVWGVPFTTPDDSANSVLTAIEMLDKFNELNKKWMRDKILNEPLRIGIGINTGIILAGKVGGHKRQDYTIMGDTVNAASRLEYETKKFCVPVVLSESTVIMAQNSSSQFQFEEIGPYQLRGKSEVTKIYKLKDVKYDGDT